VPDFLEQGLHHSCRLHVPCDGERSDLGPASGSTRICCPSHQQRSLSGRRPDVPWMRLLQFPYSQTSPGRDPVSACELHRRSVSDPLACFGWQGIELPTSFLLGLAAGRLQSNAKFSALPTQPVLGTSALEMH